MAEGKLQRERGVVGGLLPAQGVVGLYCGELTGEAVPVVTFRVLRVFDLS